MSYRLILSEPRSTLCTLSLVFVISSLCLTAVAQQGAHVNPTGNPIGGGNGYSSTFISGDFIVSPTSQLLQALNKANYGDIVYILSGSTINLSSHHYVEIPAGITLARNRGFSNALGPLTITNLRCR